MTTDNEQSISERLLRPWSYDDDAGPESVEAKREAKIADLEARIQRGGGEFDVTAEDIQTHIELGDFTRVGKEALNRIMDYLRDHITTVKPEPLEGSPKRWFVAMGSIRSEDTDGVFINEYVATSRFNALCDQYDAKCRYLALTEHTLQHDREAARKTLAELRETIAKLEAERDKAVRSLTQYGYTDKGGELWKPTINERKAKLRQDLIKAQDKIASLEAERDELKARLAAQTPTRLPRKAMVWKDDAERWAREYIDYLRGIDSKYRHSNIPLDPLAGIVSHKEHLAAMANVLALRDAERTNAPVPASQPKPQNLSVAEWLYLVANNSGHNIQTGQSHSLAKAIYAKVDDILQGGES